MWIPQHRGVDVARHGLTADHTRWEVQLRTTTAALDTVASIALHHELACLVQNTVVVLQESPVLEDPQGPIYKSLSLPSDLKSLYLSLSLDHKSLSLSSDLKSLFLSSDHKSLSTTSNLSIATSVMPTINQ